MQKREETNLTSPIQIRKNIFTLVNSPIIVENKKVKTNEKNGLLDQLDDMDEIQMNNDTKNSDLYEKFAVKSSNTFRKKISINSMFEEAKDDESDQETVISKSEVKSFEEKENKEKINFNCASSNFVSKSIKNVTSIRKTNENTTASVKNNAKITDYLSKFKYTNSNKLTK
jgi:hypothetical protein